MPHDLDHHLLRMADLRREAARERLAAEARAGARQDRERSGGPLARVRGGHPRHDGRWVRAA